LLVVRLDDDVGEGPRWEDEFGTDDETLALFFSSSTNLTLLSIELGSLHRGHVFLDHDGLGAAHLTKKCIVSKYSLSLMRFFR